MLSFAEWFTVKHQINLILKLSLLFWRPCCGTSVRAVAAAMWFLAAKFPVRQTLSGCYQAPGGRDSHAQRHRVCGTLTSWIRPPCATAAPGSMRDLMWTDSLSVFQSIQWNMLTTSAWLCTHFTRACSSASRTGACAQDGCLCSLFSVICIKLTHVLFSLKMKSIDTCTHLSNPSQPAVCHEITWLLYSVLSQSVLVLLSRIVNVMACF